MESEPKEKVIAWHPKLGWGRAFWGKRLGISIMFFLLLFLIFSPTPAYESEGGRFSHSGERARAKNAKFRWKWKLQASNLFRFNNFSFKNLR